MRLHAGVICRDKRSLCAGFHPDDIKWPTSCKLIQFLSGYTDNSFIDKERKAVSSRLYHSAEAKGPGTMEYPSGGNYK
jgi:hypothetical protein